MKENLKIFFLFVVGLLLAFICFNWPLNLSSSPKTTKRETATLPKLEKKALSPVSLSFSPQKLTEYEGKAFTVNVVIDSEKEVVAADLFLSYNPQVLEIEKIAPGAFFSQPQELSKNIDKTKGEILYAIGSFTPTAGEGILASFTFKGKTGGEESQILLDGRTQVAVRGGEEISLRLGEGGKYTPLEIEK